MQTSDIMDHRHLLYAFMIAYFLVSVVGLGEPNMIWDETQNTAPSIFIYDFTREFLSDPMSFSEIKDYSIDYHAHYQFALNFLHHPPLQRIIVLASYMVLGITEFASRLPSVLFGVMGILFTYLLAEALTKNRRVALLSSVMLGLLSYYFILSRMAMLEVYIAAFVTASLYFFIRFEESRRGRDAVLFGLFLGMGLLTKVYAILVLPIIILYALLTKNTKVLKSRGFLISVLLALAMAMPWYLLAFFIMPSMLGIPPVAFNLYVSYLKVGLFDPFGVLLNCMKMYLFAGVIAFLGIIYHLQRRRKDSVLLLGWLLVFFAFFLFFIRPSSSHLSRFLIPTMPAIAIVAGSFLGTFVASKRNITLILGIMAATSVVHLAYYYPGLSYDLESAALYALANTPPEGGVICPYYGVQFYFMKHDREVSRYFFMTTSKNDSYHNLLYEEYTDGMNRELGIKNPEFHYLIIKEPPEDTAIYDYYGFLFEYIPGYSSDHEYVAQHEELFTRVKSFYRNDNYKTTVYKINV